MPFSEKTQRLRHLRNGFSESPWNTELETIFKPFGLRHVIKSGLPQYVMKLGLVTAK